MPVADRPACPHCGVRHRTITFDECVDRSMSEATLQERVWGRAHFGISELWEHGRLFSQHREQSSSFKLTNAWRADVARLIMLAYPKRFPSDFFKVHQRNESLLGCYRP